MSVKNNGTAGFIRPITGSEIYMITAYHIFKKAKDDNQECALNGHKYDLIKNVYSFSEKYDMATFKVSETFVKNLGIQIIELTSKRWPPPQPSKNCGIFFCGFPGTERKTSSNPKVVIFGAFVCVGAVNSVSNTNITVHLDQEFLVNQDDQPSNDYDFGGVSGAPVLAYYYKPTQEFPSNLNSVH